MEVGSPARPFRWSGLLRGGALVLVSGACALGTSPTTSASPPTEVEAKEATNTRLYADAFLTWIYASPERDPAPIGYLRAGQSAALRSEGGTPAGRPVKRGCGRGWYAIEPAGYVCLDHTASLTRTRYSESMARLSPRPGAFPFEFALSMGSPSYRRIPVPHEWQRRERIFGEAKPRPLPPHWRGHEELVTDESLPVAQRPNFLDEGGSVSRAPESRLIRRNVPFGSMLAVTSAFESNGRSFLMSADGTVVPADRFRMFQRSSFEGVELDGGASLALPLAWPRKETTLYQIRSNASCALDGSGNGTTERVKAQGAPGELGTSPAQLSKECLVKLDEQVPPRRVLQLTGRTVDVAGTRFAEIAGSGARKFIPTRYAYVAEKRSLASIDAQSKKKWIHFTIGQGTLVTYEGERPTFATLASPGIGGVPAPGADPLDTRTTPVGTYRIQFKHRTDDMSPEQTEDRSYWIADVPFAMYFKQPFAIHVAYWHESFGEPMSGGCINVSPKDGERLFSFADPQVPADWYGVGASREFGYGTTVVIDR